MPGELALDSLAADLNDRHLFFLTRTPENGPLTVHPHEGPVERHEFGFRQPSSLSVEVDPATIDVVLTPGLCFDRRGGRLGWGKGYYDELLARMPHARAVVGVTLARFVVDFVPLEPHDRRMTHLVTERGVRLALS